MRTVIHDFDVTLNRPFLVKPGTEIRGGRVRMSNDYQDPDSRQGLLWTLPQTRDVVITGLDIEGWSYEKWHAHVEAGGSWHRRAFQARLPIGLILANNTIRHFPAEAIYICDFERLSLFDNRVELCWAGMQLDWPRATGNKGVVVNGFTMQDSWAVHVNAAPMGPSLVYPGQLTGASGIHGIGIDGGLFKNILIYGEIKGGIKVGNSRDCLFEKIVTPSLWLSGWDRPADSWIAQYRGPMVSEKMRVSNFRVGDNELGISAKRTSDGVTIQCAYKLEDEYVLENGILIAPRPGPLYAPWLRPEGIDPWRFDTVQANYDFKLLMRNVRVLDLHPDYPIRPAIVAANGASIRQENVTIEPIVQRFDNG